MGSPPDAIDWAPNEVQHQVTLSSFYMAATMVTQKQYKTVMGGANPSNHKGDDLPVEDVSWYSALIYCNKLSETEGLSKVYSFNGTTALANWGADGYRLPTEAEWEYAAKGGSTSSSLTVNAVYAGNENIDDVGWYAGNSHRTPHSVGQKKPNKFGLYDMCGNGWEWCWDWYGDYPNGPQQNPKGPPSGV